MAVVDRHHDPMAGAGAVGRPPVHSGHGEPVVLVHAVLLVRREERRERPGGAVVGAAPLQGIRRLEPGSRRRRICGGPSGRRAVGMWRRPRPGRSAARRVPGPRLVLRRPWFLVVRVQIYGLYICVDEIEPPRLILTGATAYMCVEITSIPAQ